MAKARRLRKLAEKRSHVAKNYRERRRTSAVRLDSELRRRNRVIGVAIQSWLTRNLNFIIKRWGAWLRGEESKFNTLLDLVLQWQNGEYTNAWLRPVHESEDQKRRINHDTGFASHSISHHLRRIGEFPDHG